jgi:hypothetical protein
MNCTRCRTKAHYEFDGIHFCRPHGELYLVERAYGNAEREVESFMWRVSRENQWWYEVPDLLGDRDLDRIIDDFSRMPKEERMRRLFGGNPVPNFEIAPAVFVNSESFQVGIRQAQTALDTFSRTLIKGIS